VCGSTWLDRDRVPHLDLGEHLTRRSAFPTWAPTGGSLGHLLHQADDLHIGYQVKVIPIDLLGLNSGHLVDAIELLPELERARARACVAQTCCTFRHEAGDRRGSTIVFATSGRVVASTLLERATQGLEYSGGR
jgi:hypothetical protein